MKTTKPVAKSTKPASKVPAKKPVAAVVETQNRLHPVVAKNEDAVIAAAFDGVRRRPVVAINDAGELVVCCRRTASKNGWAMEGTLFARNRTGKVLVDSKGKLALADDSKRAAASKGPERFDPVKRTEVKAKKVAAKVVRSVKEILA